MCFEMVYPNKVSKILLTSDDIDQIISKLEKIEILEERLSIAN